MASMSIHCRRVSELPEEISISPDSHNIGRNSKYRRFTLKLTSTDLDKNEAVKI